MQPLRTGILGCGSFAHRHAQIASGLPEEVELVAFCDRNDWKARAFSEQYTANRAAVLVLNSGARPVQRSYDLASRGLDGPLYCLDWPAESGWISPVSRIDLTLPGHSGRLLFLSPQPRNTPVTRLP